MEMDELKTTQELLADREKEVLVELGRCKPNDPNRSKLIGEAKTFSEIRLSYDKAEQTKAESQSKIALEDRKLDIEADKAKTERKRARGDVAKMFLYFIGGLVSGLGSYFLDPWFQRNQRLQRWGENLNDLINKR